jgi:hypothetical protein
MVQLVAIKYKLLSIAWNMYRVNIKQYGQCMYNVTLSRLSLPIVAVEKQ